MSKYRKVSVRIWNDKEFMDLPDDAKLVFLFVLTHPQMTAVGGLRATLAGLANELRWQYQRFYRAFYQTSDVLSVRCDEENNLIVLMNFIEHNPPENQSTAKAYAGAFDLLPDCELKTELGKKVQDILLKKGEKFRESYLKVSEMLALELEQEQEQELDSFSAFFDLYDSLVVLIGEPRPGKHREALLTLDQIVRLDGHEKESILPCLQWCLASTHKDAKFWSGQIHSITGLRKLVYDNTTPKFTAIHKCWKKAKPKDDDTDTSEFTPEFLANLERLEGKKS
jgi:hypothetical protein